MQHQAVKSTKTGVNFAQFHRHGQLAGVLRNAHLPRREIASAIGPVSDEVQFYLFCLDQRLTKQIKQIKSTRALFIAMKLFCLCRHRAFAVHAELN